MNNILFKVYCKAIIKTNEFAMLFTLYCCKIIIVFTYIIFYKNILFVDVFKNDIYIYKYNIANKDIIYFLKIFIWKQDCTIFMYHAICNEMLRYF